MITARAKREQQQRQAKVDNILAGALDLAVQEGIDAVTTTRLAAKLGYTVGALYRYWPSIDALLAALHQHTAELFYSEFFSSLPALRARLAGGKPKTVALAELLLLPRCYARIAQSHPKHFELVNQLLTRRWAFLDRAAMRQVNALILPRIAEIIAITATAAERGALEPGDAALRTTSLWLAVHASLSLAPLAERHPGLFEVDRITNETAYTFVRGWGASPKEIAGALALVDAALKKK